MITRFTNITDAIFEHAANTPKAVAVEDLASKLTYKQFADLIGRASVWLKSQGIRAGAVVGVRMNNSVDHLILSLALLRVGAAKVEFNTGGDGKSFDEAVHRLDVEVLFIEPPLMSLGVVRCITIGLNWHAELAAYKGDFRHEEGLFSPYEISLSSGSTGPAKGVPLTHAQSLRRFEQWKPTYLRAGVALEDQTGTYIVVLSMAFAGIWMALEARLVFGGKVVFMPSYAKLIDFVRGVRAHQDAIFLVTPDLCRELLTFAQGDGPLFPDVRCMVCTGNPLPPNVKRDVIQSLTPNLLELYGNSGAGLISALYADEIATHSDSVGRVFDGVTVEIVDAADQQVGPNVVGYMRCKGDGVVGSLIAGLGTGAEGIRDGWYYPGDMGALDEEGYLYLRGRATDVIKRAGVDVLPSVAEMALMTHATVQEAVVVGISRPRGAELVAVVTVREGQGDPRSLYDHCLAAVGAAHTPSVFLFVTTLPRTAAGKIDRARVREHAIQTIAANGWERAGVR